jgi:hydrogenase nickel incorporation protein HypA/HybF
MHEMSVAKDIIDIVQQQVSQNSGGKVTWVKLKIGNLSGVVSDSLEFCFNVLKEGTPLDKAKLLVESVPVQGKCRDCGRTFNEDNYLFHCPHCNSIQVDILAGRELQVVEFEMDEHTENTVL